MKMKSKTSSNFIFAIGFIAFILIVVTIVLSLQLYSKRTESSKEGFDKPWHNYVDVIYYINLDNRADRKKEFLDEMRRMQVPNEKIVRISAIQKPGQGDWGCSLSHLITIEKFLDTKHNNCIVFEDDFVFTQDMDQINKMFESTLKKVKNYDVIMLSANEVDVKPTEHEYLKKVNDAQTASGYMLNKSFATTLLQNYREGTKLIEKSYEGGKSDQLQGPFCVDQYWKRLQPQSNWYMFSPKLGVQRKSHSDIQGGVVDYGV